MSLLCEGRGRRVGVAGDCLHRGGVSHDDREDAIQLDGNGHVVARVSGIALVTGSEQRVKMLAGFRHEELRVASDVRDVAVRET